MSDIKLTALDSNEIPRYTYDEARQAIRVVISDVELGDIGKYIQESLKDFKVEIPQEIKATQPIIIKETEFRDLPVIVREIEYKEIPFPVIQTEVKIIEIEKPIIQKELEIRTIEVPIIVKEKEIVYVDRLNHKVLFVLQALTLGLILLSKFIK